MDNTIRVVVIDDHLVSRAGIVGLLARNSKISVVAEGWAGNHVLELLEKHSPDVLLTDLQMPAHADGREDVLFEPISVLQRALQRYPQTAIIVISQEHDVSTIQSLAEVGVRGYFLKTDNITQSLGIVVEHIHQGMLYFSPDVRELVLSSPKITSQVHLTKQQLNVLRAIARSPEASRREIATSMHISPSTLQKHIKAIFEALGEPNVVSSVLKAMRMGIIDLNGQHEHEND